MSKTLISAFEPNSGIPAKPGDDLIFVFSDFKLNITFFNENDDFDENKVKKFLKLISKEIWIDKTYVDFEGTKYKNVFLKEDGWNQLSEFVWKPINKKNKINHIVLRNAFESMIIAYMEHISFLLGYDPSQIEFQVDPNSNIKLRLLKDTAKEWLTYPGSWQDWSEYN